jgi:polyisoprenoid-binding protein YceI
MTESSWTLGPDNGELHILTGVEGRAAKMGHRLTLAMQSWQADMQFTGDTATKAELTVDVNSLEVLRGEGGVKALSEPEKGVCKSNAFKSMDVKKYPQIRFVSDDIVKTAGGYRMTGTLEIHGTSRPQVVDLAVDDTGAAWTLSARAAVKQTDYGVKPFSLFMGTLKVADEVTIDFHATQPK